MNSEATGLTKEIQSNNTEAYTHAVRRMTLRSFLPAAEATFRRAKDQPPETVSIRDKHIGWVGSVLTTAQEIPLYRTRTSDKLPRIFLTSGADGNVPDAKPAMFYDGKGRVNADVQANTYRILSIKASKGEMITCVVAHPTAGDRDGKEMDLPAHVVAESYMMSDRADIAGVLTPEDGPVYHYFKGLEDNSYLADKNVQQSIEQYASEHYITGDATNAFIEAQLKIINTKLAAIPADTASEERTTLENQRNRLSEIQTRFKPEQGTGSAGIFPEATDIAEVMMIAFEGDFQVLQQNLGSLEKTMSSNQFASLKNLIDNPQAVFTDMFKDLQSGNSPETAQLITTHMKEGNQDAIRAATLKILASKMHPEEANRTLEMLKEKAGPAAGIMLLLLALGVSVPLGAAMAESARK